MEPKLNLSLPERQPEQHKPPKIIVLLLGAVLLVTTTQLLVSLLQRAGGRSGAAMCGLERALCIAKA
jgi:hypothetical protein